MAKLNFRINIPDSIYRFRWTNVKNYLSYHLKPYRCKDCGIKMPFSHFDIIASAKYPLKYRAGISHHGSSAKQECVCPTCLSNRVYALAAQENFMELQDKDYNVEEKCGVCGEVTLAFKFIHFTEEPWGDRLHFLVHSWNSEHVCLDCIQTILKHGEMQSSIMTSMGNRFVYLNGKGLPVINGEVRFPFK